MDFMLADGLQGLLAVVGGEEAVILPGEIDLQGLHDVPVIVADQNVVHTPPPFSALPSRGAPFFFSGLWYQVSRKRKSAFFLRLP